MFLYLLIFTNRNIDFSQKSNREMINHFLSSHVYYRCLTKITEQTAKKRAFSQTLFKVNSPYYSVYSPSFYSLLTITKSDEGNYIITIDKQFQQCDFSLRALLE